MGQDSFRQIVREALRKAARRAELGEAKGGYGDWTITFRVVGKEGNVALAEIIPPPGDVGFRGPDDVSWSWLQRELPDTYVPYSGLIPGEGQARNGRIDKPHSSVMAVTTDGQYPEIFHPDLVAWAGAMRRLGFRTQVR